MRSRILEQADAERQRGLGFAYGAVSTEPGPRNFLPPEQNEGEPPNRWVELLVNKGRVFCDLLEHPLVEEMLENFLGEDFMLSSYAAHITSPGGPLQPMHTDQWWMPRPTPRNLPHRPPGNILRGEHYNDADGPVDKLISAPVVANIMWPLDKFTIENGVTRIVPGSHLSGDQPDPEVTHEETAVHMVGPPGSAIVFDGRVWHGAGANRSNALRVGLLSTFCSPVFRQQENYALGTAPEIRNTASPRLLTRLGLKPWRAYGRVASDTVKLVCLEDDFVGELTPE